jgi:transposase
VVERIFAWLGQVRRFSKVYKKLPETTEGMIYGVMSSIMVRNWRR